MESADPEMRISEKTLNLNVKHQSSDSLYLSHQTQPRILMELSAERRVGTTVTHPAQIIFCILLTFTELCVSIQNVIISHINSIIIRPMFSHLVTWLD